MMDIGSVIRGLDRELTSGKVEKLMMECGKTTRGKEKVEMYGQQAKLMKEIGLITYVMGRDMMTENLLNMKMISLYNIFKMIEYVVFYFLF